MLYVLILKKQTGMGNDETEILLAKHFSSAYFPSSALLHLCYSFGILGILISWDIFWQLVDFGLSFEIVTLYLHMLSCFELCSWFWTMQLVLTKFEFVHFNTCAFIFNLQTFSSLFVNREKSRDLQRGLTDSSQLPLMMSPN